MKQIQNISLNRVTHILDNFPLSSLRVPFTKRTSIKLAHQYFLAYLEVRAVHVTQ